MKGIGSPPCWPIVLVLLQVKLAHCIQFQPVELTGNGDGECALLLNGPAKSSQFDYSLNLLRGSTL
ncbi:hypothetical protein NQ314_006551 [Rhamnusium bicolor]|uniref:Uncharacterized protein n=1 Tax=Rhamnusium bicolor TaxID=1586634 RepID=A0AAV8Z298_9CUCU|nr:hypothetical protein NQ314_006551 [Rhamnusium bicolor]